MNLAQAFFHFANRQTGRGFGGRANVLPVELKCGKFDLWPVLAAAFADRTGMLQNIDAETVTPSDLAALLRVGYVATGSENIDAEALFMTAIQVLREVRSAMAEAYASARPPSADIDAAGVLEDCDDAPKRPGRQKKRAEPDPRA